MSKCCSTCCNRISRKLAALTGHVSGSADDRSAVSLDNPSDPNSPKHDINVKETEGAGPGISGISSDDDNSAYSGEDDIVSDGERFEPPPRQTDTSNENQRQPAIRMPAPPPPPPATSSASSVPVVATPACDNSETDSADEVGAIQHSASIEVINAHNSSIHHSNGSNAVRDKTFSVNTSRLVKPQTFFRF